MVSINNFQWNNIVILNSVVSLASNERKRFTLVTIMGRDNSQLAEISNWQGFAIRTKKWHWTLILTLTTDNLSNFSCKEETSTEYK